MLKGILSKVFGTRHERERKRIQPIVDEINQHYERLQSVSEEELRGQTARFRGILTERTEALEQRVAALKETKRATKEASEREAIDLELGGADGRGGLEKELRDEIAEVLDELLPEAFATVREAGTPAGRLDGAGDRPGADLGHGAVRRAADRRDRPAPGQDRRNGDRRRQDARRHPAAVPQCPWRGGGAPGHGQQLPGPARLAVDGPPVHLPRPHDRLPRRHRALLARAPRGLQRRHHLRDQQRVRVRLPARQHGVLAGAAGAARAELRHRRRGRLDPDRRGPDAAHHLRAGGERERRQVRPAQSPGGGAWSGGRRRS